MELVKSIHYIIRYSVLLPGPIPGVAGIFSVASGRSMCPGADSTSNSEYQDIPVGKGGRCVRLTTYHLYVPIVKKSGGLNLLEPCGPLQVCNENSLPLPSITFKWFITVVCEKYNKEYERYQIVRTNTTLLFVDVEQTDYMFDIYT